MLRPVLRYGTLIGVVAMVAFFWLSLPDTFMTLRNWLNISQQMSMLAVVAFTMTAVMAMGDFDLSVGSMASLAGIVAALAFVATGSAALGVAAALALAAAPVSLLSIRRDLLATFMERFALDEPCAVLDRGAPIDDFVAAVVAAAAAR